MLLVWLETRKGSPQIRRLPQNQGPTVTVYTHTSGMVSGRLLSRQIVGLFEKAGWQVSAAFTDVVRHAKGLWIHGGTQAEQASASWGLSTLSLSPKIDDEDDKPPMLQVIIGEPKPKAPAVGRMGDDKEALKVQAATAKMERDEARKERDAARTEARKYQTAYQQSLRTIALGKLESLAWHYERAKHPVISVTVRFIDYQDHRMADWLETIFRGKMDWPVKQEHVAGSRIRPIGDLRVLFELELLNRSSSWH